MPRTITADGRRIVVPDDATDEEINQLVGPPPDPKNPAADRGFLGSAYDQTVGGLVNTIAHPVDTAKGLYHGVVDNVQKGIEDYKKEGLTPTTRRDFGRAIPVAGPLLDTAQAQHDSGNDAGMAGTLLGGIAGLAAPEAIKAAIPRAAEATRNLYPKPASLSPAESSARGLGKALVVPTQGMQNFIDAASGEAGKIKGYAAANNIPINSTVDLSKAAQATAKAAQDHFNEVIMKPNAGEVVSVPSEYRGNKLNVEGSRASLDDVNKRINAINAELSPNYRQGLQMKVNASNVSDAELKAEKSKLTDILHNTLAKKTGLSPDEIASMRQQAGKLRTIADEAQLSANTNTTAAGKADMGRSDIPTGTKMGIIERGIQKLQGGPEIIGNRMVNRALRDISPTELVLPNPRGQVLANEIANPVSNQVSVPSPRISLPGRRIQR